MAPLWTYGTSPGVLFRLKRPRYTALYLKLLERLTAQCIFYMRQTHWHCVLAGVADSHPIISSDAVWSTVAVRFVSINQVFKHAFTLCAAGLIPTSFTSLLLWISESRCEAVGVMKLFPSAETEISKPTRRHRGFASWPLGAIHVFFQCYVHHWEDQRNHKTLWFVFIWLSTLWLWWAHFQERFTETGCCFKARDPYLSRYHTHSHLLMSSDYLVTSISASKTDFPCLLERLLLIWFVSLLDFHDPAQAGFPHLLLWYFIYFLLNVEKTKLYFP